MSWLHVEVVRGLESLLPCSVVDLHCLIDVSCLEVHISRERLVHPLLCSRCHFDVRKRRSREGCLVYILYVLRNTIDLTDISLVFNDSFLYIIPDTHVLEILYQVVVDVEI